MNVTSQEQSSGKNMGDMLDLNRALILRYLLQNEGCSRAELAKYTGLKQASITKIIKTLIENGVVKETGFSAGQKGRRSIGLSLSYSRYHVIGVKLSWSCLKICVYDFLGNAAEETLSFPLEERFHLHLMDYVVDLIDQHVHALLKKYPTILAAGFSLPGPFDPRDGVILNNRTPGSHEIITIPICERIMERLELPVFFEHDANAGAMAYWWFHLGCDPQKVLLHILASEGLGGGIISNGHTLTNFGSRKTEFGHISVDYNGRLCPCGNRGCLSEYCCFEAIQRQIKEQLCRFPGSVLAQYNEVTPDQFFQAVHGHDPLASGLITDMGRYLGYGLCSFITEFCPDIIVISDIMAAGGNLLLDSIHSVINERLSIFFQKPEIVLLDPQYDLVLLGAATTAIHNVLLNPTRYMINRKAE
ncbi:ROK family transcriptional regulator [Anaerolentibacter hominis]|uniref:ROK family transcriptional regulator n=1 Tax=Anaerolentibacter hominis TaxID=3079009 RepID=UPI0031B8017F